MNIRPICFVIALSAATLAHAGPASRFCLDGEFDLGARYQGTAPSAGEWYPARWCLVTEVDTERVLFHAEGRSNPDLDGQWTVAYLPPDRVRIVKRDDPPDIEFVGTDNAAEARAIRRIDPMRLAEELAETPAGIPGLRVQLENGRVTEIRTRASLPLRGDVPVAWQWDWSDTARPALRIILDDTPVFRAVGARESLKDDEAARYFEQTPGGKPVEIPGENWPSRIAMQLEPLGENVYLVRGVRTGFQHLVVDTTEGLVVADAPAGWVELHQLPPRDLVPGLGVSGLSEQLIAFLGRELPARPIAAVALTHHHDDHAGGARAFAAAGASVYAPAMTAGRIEELLNRDTMPPDALAASGERVEVLPVGDTVVIGRGNRSARLVPIGPGPHAADMLGVAAPSAGLFFVSDIHVPNSDADEPRAGRRTTECWFADWAVKALDADDRVLNSHSRPVTPVSRLQAYLESDGCSG